MIHTLYPDAIALPINETDNIAEGGVRYLCKSRFPSEILKDRGSQFRSQLMEGRTCRLISLKRVIYYHVQSKMKWSLWENDCYLKNLLKKMCQERPKNWDRYLSAVLFANREAISVKFGVPTSWAITCIWQNC
jgi:hypothetical protein